MITPPNCSLVSRALPSSMPQAGSGYNHTQYHFPLNRPRPLWDSSTPISSEHPFTRSSIPDLSHGLLFCCIGELLCYVITIVDCLALIDTCLTRILRQSLSTAGRRISRIVAHISIHNIPCQTQSPFKYCVVEYPGLRRAASFPGVLLCRCLRDSRLSLPYGAVCTEGFQKPPLFPALHRCA